MTDRQYEPGMEPVFLQALWRTGSTYLWGKFRSRDEFRGYFEPLHEALYCKTREKLKADYDHAVQKYGHSFISHNYYDEFNIRASGGAEHFERRFTLERYAMSPQDEDPELKRYIGSLIDNAANEGQAAVMQFGAEQGEFGAFIGKDSKGRDHLHHIPWGDIPARPFLGFSEEDRTSFIAQIEDWLESTAAGGD